MEITEKDIQLIEDAILDRLSDEDKILFIERQKDVIFSKEFEQHKHLINEVRSEGKADLKKSLRRLDKKMSQNQPDRGKTIPMYIRWLVAASLIGIIGYLGMLNFATDDTQKIYTKYYETYPNIIDPLTKGIESGELSAYQLYETGKFESAQSEFSDLEKSEERDFYHAITFLESKEFAIAINLLSRITQNTNHRFYSEAQWYMALSYLGLQNIEAAKEELIKITKEESHPFRDRAIRLHEELE